MMAVVQTFRTTNIILANNYKFNFIGLIPEAMFRSVPEGIQIMQKNRGQPTSGLRPISDVIRQILEEADKPKKGGKKKRPVKEGPSEPVQTPKK